MQCSGGGISFWRRVYLPELQKGLRGLKFIITRFYKKFGFFIFIKAEKGNSRIAKGPYSSCWPDFP